MLALLWAWAPADEAPAAAKLAAKNIDISLSARWPASPAAVEAAEYMSEEDATLFWRFAEGMVSADAAPEHVRNGGGTDQEHFDHVLKVSAGLLSELGLRVLKSFLAAHVLSPRAEMWHATRSHVACVRTIGLFLCRVIWRRGSRAGARREWWGEGKRRRGQQVVVRSLGRGRREAQVLRRRQKQPSVSGGVIS